jgi:hypothetical protein
MEAKGHAGDDQLTIRTKPIVVTKFEHEGEQYGCGDYAEGFLLAIMAVSSSRSILILNQMRTPTATGFCESLDERFQDMDGFLRRVMFVAGIRPIHHVGQGRAKTTQFLDVKLTSWMLLCGYCSCSLGLPFVCSFMCS